ncbi:MAG: alpha-L-fucosidase [Mariniphaga sp.]
MNTKVFFTCILLIFCTFQRGDAIEKIAEYEAGTRLKTDRSTFLYVSKATHIVGELIKQGGDYIEWKGNAEMGWAISVPKVEKYDLFLIADIPGESKNIEIVFTSGVNSHKFIINPTSGPWGSDGKNFQRMKVLSDILLTKGNQEVSIKSITTATDKTLLNVRSLELVPVSAYKSIEIENKRVLASRASTKWLTKAGYGVMFHWTSQSVNPDGSNKPYEQAVNAFDVRNFANMVEETGAGYVIFTIGHAEAYCPAPLKKWEKYHPGMTTKRDLIAEISDQLKTKNIRLICYLPTHIVAKYQKVNGTEFMKINTEILQEMGERYKDKIAGYWFDGWYQCIEEYPDVSFKSFFEATKAGNKDRIIALNSWIYPPVTPWQEYWAGEVVGPVAIPEKGFMKDGPAPDLRYQALLIMEPYWVQEKAEMPDPNFTSAELSQYISNCMDNGGAVTINMGIYQDGTIGAKALEVIKGVRKQIRAVK